MEHLALEEGRREWGERLSQRLTLDKKSFCPVLFAGIDLKTIYLLSYISSHVERMRAVCICGMLT